MTYNVFGGTLNLAQSISQLRRTLTLTHTITAYSVSGNVVRVRILICATRQKPFRKRVYLQLAAAANRSAKLSK